MKGVHGGKLASRQLQLPCREMSIPARGSALAALQKGWQLKDHLSFDFRSPAGCHDRAIWVLEQLLLLNPTRADDPAFLFLLGGLGCPSLDCKDQYGWTLLMVASLNGATNMVNLLTEAGVDPNHREPYGFPALMIAALAGHAAIIASLLAAGSHVNAFNDGHTALMLAVREGHTSAVRALLAGGAEPGIVHGGQTAHGIAAQLGLVHIQKLLLQAGPRPAQARRAGASTRPPDQLPGHRRPAAGLGGAATAAGPAGKAAASVGDQNSAAPLMLAWPAGVEPAPPPPPKQPAASPTPTAVHDSSRQRHAATPTQQVAATTARLELRKARVDARRPSPAAAAAAAQPSGPTAGRLGPAAAKEPATLAAAEPTADQAAGKKAEPAAGGAVGSKTTRKKPKRGGGGEGMACGRYAVLGSLDTDTGAVGEPCGTLSLLPGPEAGAASKQPRGQAVVEQGAPGRGAGQGQPAGPPSLKGKGSRAKGACPVGPGGLGDAAWGEGAAAAQLPGPQAPPQLPAAPDTAPAPGDGGKGKRGQDDTRRSDQAVGHAAPLPLALMIKQAAGSASRPAGATVVHRLRLTAAGAVAAMEQGPGQALAAAAPAAAAAAAPRPALASLVLPPALASSCTGAAGPGAAPSAALPAPTALLLGLRRRLLRVEEAEDEEERLCVVCMEVERGVLLRPCGHWVMCEACCSSVRAARNECPVCRCIIESSEEQSP